MITQHIHKMQQRVAGKTAIDLAVIAEGIGITRSCAIFDPHQQKLVAKAAAEIRLQGGAKDDDEARVLAIDERLTIHHPETPTVGIPKTLTDTLAAAEAEHAPYAERRNVLQNRWIAQSEKYQKSLAEKDADEADRLEREWKDAELACRPTARAVAKAENAIDAYRRQVAADAYAGR